MTSPIEIKVKFEVDDRVLTPLHDRAFGTAADGVAPWGARLRTHSLSWIGAFEDDRLVGFVHAVWDGGKHAFLLDTVVDPVVQHRGIGVLLVTKLREEVQRAGCEWLHVDFEPELRSFYERCGFRSTAAGLLRLA